MITIDFFYFSAGNIQEKRPRVNEGASTSSKLMLSRHECISKSIK